MSREQEEKMFDGITNIHEDIIEDALDEKLGVHHNNWKSWCVLAACAVLVVGFSIMINKINSVPTEVVSSPGVDTAPRKETPPQINTSPKADTSSDGETLPEKETFPETNTTPEVDTSAVNDEDTKLPKITLDLDYNGGTMGFEGYMAYNIDELVNENPWNENSEITHLPVIKNTNAYENIEDIYYVDIEAMEELLKETARNLGMDVENLPITTDATQEEVKERINAKLEDFGDDIPEWFTNPTTVIMEEDNIKVEVDTSVQVRVDFNPPIQLPEEFNFNYSATYAEYYKVAEYLQNEYKNYINMENPKINISGGDYTFDGEQLYSLSFFEDTGEETENILNYNFRYVTFAADDDGKLFVSRTFNEDLTNVIGNYPIINKEQALKLLEDKKYIATVPVDFPGSEYVRKVELAYRGGSIYIPYYRIYVELPSMKVENGLNTYGAYYVPAVDEKYIENMPIAD